MVARNEPEYRDSHVERSRPSDPRSLDRQGARAAAHSGWSRDFRRCDALRLRSPYRLALGGLGGWLLGVVALAWTIDCFVGFYLTLPMSSQVSGAAGSRPGSSNGAAAPIASISICTAPAACGSGRCSSSSPGRASDSSTASPASMARSWAFSAAIRPSTVAQIYPDRPDLGPPKLDARAAQARGEALAAQEIASREGFHLLAPISLQSLNYVDATTIPCSPTAAFPAG